MTHEPRLPTATGSALPCFDAASCTWHSEQRDGERLLLRLGRQHEFLVAEDTRYGTLVASDDGSSYRFDPAEGADPILVAKFTSSVVRALVRELRGELSLHGAAIAFDGSAVAFVGPAFAGKSTLAHACVRLGGAQLVADDTVAFAKGTTRPTVLPMQRGTWLLGDGRDFFGEPPSPERKVFAALPCVDGQVPLRAIVLLEHAANEAEETFERVRGLDAFRRLSPHVFRFRPPSADGRRSELDRLADLTPSLAVYTFRRTRRFEALKGHVERVRLTALAP